MDRLVGGTGGEMTSKTDIALTLFNKNYFELTNKQKDKVDTTYTKISPRQSRNLPKDG